tara:strand:- start:275 stop:427 length:153 start_codon:yes stop_codon:yes gene_type:complete
MYDKKIKNPYNLGSENEWFDDDGLDYEVDYFSKYDHITSDNENTECEGEG